MQKINKISSKNPFKVPDNYFNEVSNKILASISETETGRDVRKISLYRRFRTSLLVAASIAGFVIISYTAVRLFVPHHSDIQLSETINEINNESIMNDVDVFTLEESLSSSMLPEEGPDVSKKDLIDFLLQNNVELNDIYEQL
jgi:hypothetical protein